MAYTHLGRSERDRIEALLVCGHTQCEIASILKVNKSTVSREIKHRKRMDGRYDSDTAQHKARVKRLYSKYQGMKIQENPSLRSLIIAGLNSHRSPDEISGRLNEDTGYCVLNHKAIYKWLYSVWREIHALLMHQEKKKEEKGSKQTT